MISRHDKPLDTRRVVDRLERDDHLNGRAIGVGNNTAVFVTGDFLGIHLGNHQRNIRLHAKNRRVVDDHRARSYGKGREFGAHAAAGREQTDVDSFEGILIQHFNAKLPALKGQKLARGSFRGQKPQLTDGKFAFFQNFAHLLADRAGSADDGDVVLFFLHD